MAARNRSKSIRSEALFQSMITRLTVPLFTRPLAVFPLLARPPSMLRRQHHRGRRLRWEEVPAGDGGLLRVFAP